MPRKTETQERIEQLERENTALRADLQRARQDPGEAPFHGCSDGGCIVKRQVGMHTNGGCHCPEDKVQMRRLVLWLRQRDAYMRSVVDLQRSEIASLELRVNLSVEALAEPLRLLEEAEHCETYAGSTGKAMKALALLRKLAGKP